MTKIGENIEFKSRVSEKKKSTQHKVNVVYSCTRNNVG